MVQDRLQGIVNVQGNPSAFAAVTEEVSLVTWGDATLGGDSSVIRSKLQQKVRQVTPSLKGFFAILEDWSLIYWGGTSGIGMSAVKHQLTSVLPDLLHNELLCGGSDPPPPRGSPGPPSVRRGGESLADPAVPMSLAPCMEIWHLFGCTRERLWQHLDGSLRVLPSFFEAMPVPPLIDNGGRSGLWKWGGGTSHHLGDMLDGWFEHSTRWVTSRSEGFCPRGVISLKHIN